MLAVSNAWKVTIKVKRLSVSVVLQVSEDWSNSRADSSLGIFLKTTEPAATTKVRPCSARSTRSRFAGIMSAVILALLLALFFSLVPPSTIRKTEVHAVLGDVHALKNAVHCYRVEYGSYPGQVSGTNDHLYTDDEYPLLVATLCGSNFLWNGKVANPRGIVFLSFDGYHVKAKADDHTARVGEWADAWGNRFEVVADWNGDGAITLPLADGEAVQDDVAVWSFGSGAKPVANRRDSTHIRSWRELGFRMRCGEAL